MPNNQDSSACKADCNKQTRKCASEVQRQNSFLFLFAIRKRVFKERNTLRNSKDKTVSVLFLLFLGMFNFVFVISFRFLRFAVSNLVRIQTACLSNRFNEVHTDYSKHKAVGPSSAAVGPRTPVWLTSAQSFAH